MGSSYWSDATYSTNVTSRVRDKGSAFDHDYDIRTGKVDAKVHKNLDPKGLKVRESRDSKEHPNSNAIIVALDVTGSMGTVVRTIHSKLPTLMGLLLRKDYIVDPQILFAAVGDANGDSYPLQVGQFESGAEMEDHLSKVVLEGGGGGQIHETYELMAYVGARKTSIDCLEKRGKKGYFFFIGDELPYEKVAKRHVNDLIGPELEADISTEQIFKELKEKYHVFFIRPTQASYSGMKSIHDGWAKLVGEENVLNLDDASGVAELIASQIGLCEGAGDVDTILKDLKDVGTSEALVHVVRGSVSRAYSGGAVTKVTPGTLTPSSESSDVKRL